jgi:hypothetical protein
LIAVFSGASDLDFKDYLIFTYKYSFDEEEPSLDETNDVELAILKEMSIELFKIYKSEKDFLPKIIAFYRQTRNIRTDMITFHKKEVAAIKQAHKEVDRDYIKPEVICIEISFTNITFNPLEVQFDIFSF